MMAIISDFSHVLEMTPLGKALSVLSGLKKEGISMHDSSYLT